MRVNIYLSLSVSPWFHGIRLPRVWVPPRHHWAISHGELFHFIVAVPVLRRPRLCGVDTHLVFELEQ